MSVSWLKVAFAGRCRPVILAYIIAANSTKFFSNVSECIHLFSAIEVLVSGFFAHVFAHSWFGDQLFGKIVEWLWNIDLGETAHLRIWSIAPPQFYCSSSRTRHSTTAGITVLLLLGNSGGDSIRISFYSASASDGHTGVREH